MSLTVLWWSYGWYREAVNDWAASGAPRSEAPVVATDRGEPPPFDIDVTWQAFTRAAPAWSSATLAVPKGDKPLSVRHLDADPSHERPPTHPSFHPWTLATLATGRHPHRQSHRK